jgi:putative lipoprotein
VTELQQAFITLCVVAAVATTGCIHRSTLPPKPVPNPVPEAAALPAPAILRGTVTYLQRAALPPTAVVEVRIRDLGGGAGEGFPVAEQVIRRPGQAPVAFELEVPANLFDATHEYGVTARIRVEDHVLYASESETRVLTHGAPADLQLVLVPPAGG